MISLFYFKDWASGILAQTNQDFDIWINVDGVAKESLQKLLPRNNVIWKDYIGLSPIQIRIEAWLELKKRYDWMIHLDSDDIASPSLVRDLQLHQESDDIISGELELVDEKNKSLNLKMIPTLKDFEKHLYDWNAFGLSNTAYRLEIIEKVIPKEPGCPLMDWYMITQAFLNKLKVKTVECLFARYRQYPANFFKLVPPFEKSDVIKNIHLAASHFQYLLKGCDEILNSKKSKSIQKLKDLEKLKERVENDSAYTTEYLQYYSTRPYGLKWSEITYDAYKN